jgi:hypothetical protein
MSLDDFPPGHFTYGRSDSDEPTVPEPTPAKVQDTGTKNKAQAKKSMAVKPMESAKTADAFKTFPKIANKWPRSNTTDNAAAGNKDVRPSRKHRATEKGTAVAKTVEDQKTREKQREERKKAKADKAHIIAVKAKSTVLAYKDFGRVPSPPRIIMHASASSNASLSTLQSNKPASILSDDDSNDSSESPADHAEVEEEGEEREGNKIIFSGIGDECGSGEDSELDDAGSGDSDADDEDEVEDEGNGAVATEGRKLSTLRKSRTNATIDLLGVFSAVEVDKTGTKFRKCLVCL